MRFSAHNPRCRVLNDRVIAVERGSLTRYEGRRGISWHIRISIGNDAEGNPIPGHHTLAYYPPRG